MAKQLERLQEGNNTRFETIEERTVETKQDVRTLDNKVRQNQESGKTLAREYKERMT